MYLITTRRRRPVLTPCSSLHSGLHAQPNSDHRPNRRAQPTYVLTAIVWEEETTQISIAAIVLRALIR